MAKQEKKDKYVVIKKHTLNHKVGDVVSLTEKKAKALIGKVRLQADVEKDTSKEDELKALKKENAELKAKIAELEKDPDIDKGDGESKASK